MEQTTPSALEVNIVNQRGLTPLDLLLIFPSEAGDREIEEILRGAGASRAQDIHHTPSHCPTETSTVQLQQPNDPMEYFKFKKGRDSSSDARTVLLVIAVLVATTTFQAGLSSPMGIWQDSSGSNMNGTGSGSYEPAHTAWQSIMSSYNISGFFIFYASNSIGLLYSLYMIHVLTTDFPLRLELNICMLNAHDDLYVLCCNFRNWTGEHVPLCVSFNFASVGSVGKHVVREMNPLGSFIIEAPASYQS